MAGFARWLPFAAIPKDGLVATMGDGVMHHGGGAAASEAMRVLGEISRSGLLPFAIVSTLPGGRALLIEARFPFLIPCGGMAAAFSGGEDATAYADGWGADGHGSCRLLRTKGSEDAAEFVV